MQDPIHKIISALLFGCRNGSYTVEVNGWGHIVTIHQDFILIVDGKQIPYNQVLNCLRIAGFEQRGNRFQSFNVWEPYHSLGNGMKHLTPLQMAHVVFGSEAKN